MKMLLGAGHVKIYLLDISSYAPVFHVGFACVRF